MNRVLRILALAPVFCMLSLMAYAQEEEITDDELRRYAVAMDSIDNMKAALIETISDMVKNNEVISGNRYNELSKIINDDAKLTAANASAAEIEAVRAIINKKEEETQKINETFQVLAKDYIGAKSYNKIRKALQTDAEIKAKYNAILAELQADDTGN